METRKTVRYEDVFKKEVKDHGEQAFDKNDKVILKGILEEDFSFSHTIRGKKFYKNVLKVRRNEEVFDNIQVVISEENFSSITKSAGKYAEVRGAFRSRNMFDAEGHHLRVHVFAKEISIYDEECEISNDNYIFLEGYICKETIYRTTPLGKRISDILLAVNRAGGKSSYIPCIAWNKVAKSIYSLDVGSHIKLYGRIQSREYEKAIEGSETGEKEKKTVYEVSIGRYELVE